MTAASRKMRRLLQGLGIFVLTLLVVAVLTYAALLPPDPLALPERGAELRSVVLLEPGQPDSAPVDLLVRGKLIAEIRPAQPGPVRGYILAGLADAHMHGPILPFPREPELHAFLYLYHGITMARMAAGDSRIRDAVRAGDFPGPKLLSCGPFVDGDPPLWRNSLVVTDRLSADSAVAAVAQAGYDCVKVYNELTPEASQAVYLAAAQYGLPVIGHVPWRQDASEAWIDDQQHLLGLPRATGRHSAGQFARAMLGLEQVDDARVAELAASMTEAGIALTPTLITLQRKAALGDHAGLAGSPAAQLLPRYYRDQLWHGQRGLVSSRLFTAADHARFSEVYPIAQRAVLGLYQAGVPMHSGTDAPAEFITPGAGLIEELQLLHDAGLSNAQVLELSAVTTARYLGGSAYGRLAVGAPADFVVYERSPVENLANLASRSAVVSDGRFYSRKTLDAQLQRYKEWFDNPIYRAASESLVGAGLWLLNALSGQRS